MTKYPGSYLLSRFSVGAGRDQEVTSSVYFSQKVVFSSSPIVSCKLALARGFSRQGYEVLLFVTRACLHSHEKRKTITPILQPASVALPTGCGLLLYLSYSFLSGHTAPQRYDSLADHRPSPSDPRHGGQRTGRDQQTNGRPRGGRIPGGR